MTYLFDCLKYFHARYFGEKRASFLFWRDDDPELRTGWGRMMCFGNLQVGLGGLVVEFELSCVGLIETSEVNSCALQL